MSPSTLASTVTPEQLVERLTWRYATKRFDPSYKLAPELWQALERTLVLAPSSFGLQPWHFVVVTDPAMKARLRPISWDQPQVVEASHLVVFAHRKGYGPADLEQHMARTAKVRGVARESLAPYEKVVLSFLGRPGFDADEWTRRQTYLAIGSLLTAAALLGVDACPMEGIDPVQYDRTLGLDTRGFAAVCAVALGRRASDDKYASLAKVRFEAGALVTRI
jgi:nitroreductase